MWKWLRLPTRVRAVRVGSVSGTSTREAEAESTYSGDDDARRQPRQEQI